MTVIFEVIYFAMFVYLLLNIGLIGGAAVMCFLYSSEEKGSLKGGIKRFVILVPSHNEEDSIQNTVTSLRNIDYASDKFRIIVIADNCSDKTAQVARDSGAEVIERFHETKKSKGILKRITFTLS